MQGLNIAERFSHSGKVILTGEHTQFEHVLEAMLTEMAYTDEYRPAILYDFLKIILLNMVRHGTFLYSSADYDTSISSDINQALDYIVRNFSQPLTLTDVAGYVGLAPTYFSMKMKKVTGSSFKNYLLSVRLKAASRMLQETNDSITFIALECGFTSSNYFKDCFRKHFGISPTRYRKNSQLARKV